MSLTEGEAHTQQEWCSLLGIGNSLFSELIGIGIFTSTKSEWRLELVGTLFLNDRGAVCTPHAARLFSDFFGFRRSGGKTISGATHVPSKKFGRKAVI
jgi:hypothetical protein